MARSVEAEADSREQTGSVYKVMCVLITAEDKTAPWSSRHYTHTHIWTHTNTLMDAHTHSVLHGRTEQTGSAFLQTRRGPV